MRVSAYKFNNNPSPKYGMAGWIHIDNQNKFVLAKFVILSFHWEFYLFEQMQSFVCPL